jgi:hypothetical protein
MGVVVEDVAEGVLGKISVDVAEVVHVVLDEEIQEVLENLVSFVQLITTDLRLMFKVMLSEICLVAGVVVILITSSMIIELINGVRLRSVLCATSILEMIFMILELV